MSAWTGSWKAAVATFGLALAGTLAGWGIIKITSEPSPAPTPVTSTVAPTTTSTTLPVPVSTAPVWKVPAAQLTIDPRSSEWARRFMVPNHGTVLTLGLSTLGEYTTPVYDARTANRTIRVFRNTSLGGGWQGYSNGQSIPWNDAWKPAAGNDAFEIITNPVTGESTEMYHASWPAYSTAVNNSLGCLNLTNLLAGFDSNRDMCAVSVLRITDPKGALVSVFTYSGNSPSSSGGGLQNEPLVIKASEVAAGRIDHAIGVFSENTGYGVDCSPADYLNPAKFMVSCSGAIAPAGQFEGIGRTAPVGGDGSIQYPLTDQLPEGLRFSLKMTDAQINAWLDSRGLTGIDRQTARTIAVGLRDFGWILKDTNGPYGGVIVQSDGDPAWRNQVTGDGRHLLDGLFQADRIVAYVPAVNHCADGRVTVQWCWASSVTLR